VHNAIIEERPPLTGGAVLINRVVKKLFRAAGIDIRFVPKLGFDAFADMRKAVAKDRPLIFDVGANRGQTIERFRARFAQPIIHAFEPGRDTFVELQRRTAGIPDLRVSNVALGPRSESRVFFDNDHSDMSSLLEPSADAWGKIKSKYPVDVITCDDYCETHGIERIDILKVDTQGSELDVIKGAQRMLDGHAIHLIYMEIGFSDMYKGSPRLDETYGFLADRGFALVAFYDFYFQHDRASWTDALFVQLMPAPPR
jgi:FkbM family methyltransferase